MSHLKTDKGQLRVISPVPLQIKNVAPGTEANDVVTKKQLDAARSGGSSYLVYTALLSQNGANNAPTAVVLENTLGTVSFTYAGAGSYRIVCSELVQHKTFISIQQGSGNIGRISADLNIFELAGINDIYINTVDETVTGIDDVLSSTPFEIRVYS